MKKIAALLLVLMLVAASSAFADAIPGLEDGVLTVNLEAVNGAESTIRIALRTGGAAE